MQQQKKRTKDSERILDRLYKILAEVFENPRWGLNEMDRALNTLNDGNFEIAIDATKDLAEECFDSMKSRDVRGNRRGVPRKTFTKIGRGEVRLEKLISASVEEIYNQFNLISGLTGSDYDHVAKKMNIDLVALDTNNLIAEMIELKDEKNPENPLSAMFQLILYLYLYNRAKSHISCGYRDAAVRLKLTVLAPYGYYKRHGAGVTQSDNLRTLARRVSKKLGKEYSFSFQAFDPDNLPMKEFEVYLKKMQVGFEQRYKI